jgi:transcription elongation GreA/GreB family factor
MVAIDIINPGQNHLKQMDNMKRTIVEAGLRKQSEVINDFRTRIKDVMANDGNVNEESYDNHQQTFQAQVLAEVTLLNDELEFANHELLEMKKIDSDYKHDVVDFGSVVETDQQAFFVSASIEDFTVGDKQFFGISVKSPIYSAMKGRKVGDQFSSHKKLYRIKAIY